MNFGYIRSTDQKIIDNKAEILKKAGCDQIFFDHITAENKKTPGLERLKTLLKKGDSLMIVKITDLTRNFCILSQILLNFYLEGVEVKILDLDENRSMGERIFKMILNTPVSEIFFKKIIKDGFRL